METQFDVIRFEVNDFRYLSDRQMKGEEREILLAIISTNLLACLCCETKYEIYKMIRSYQESFYFHLFLYVI